MKILFLEDDKLFSQTIEDFLDDSGYEVDLAYDVDEALALSYENRYDLYLLDINVPKGSGLSFLDDLRASDDNTPAIFLTSYKDKDSLQKGFLVGADDYIKKPVDLDELLLRINAILKRSGKVNSKLEFDTGFIYEPSLKKVSKDGSDLNLSFKNIQLLELFLENKEKIISKEMIVNRLWDDCEEYSDGSIRVYVNHIKKILGKEKVVNIKGVGYKFES